jgi:hypothetical protein
VPDPNGVVSVALDFDGTAVAGWPGAALRWRPGAREFLEAAREAGVRVVIHTCRAIPGPGKAAPGEFLPDVEAADWLATGAAPAFVAEGWAMRQEMLAFLGAEGFSDLEIWEGPGKPMCDHYVDDRAEGPNLVAFAAELGLSSGDGRRGDPALGSERPRSVIAAT